MTVEEVPKAALQQDDDIVIRMVRTCVCGSDLWFFRGLSGQAAHSQVGHETIGVVEETGAAVESVKPGDFVVVPFPYSCGKCPVCKAGFESSCPHGGYFGDEGLGLPGGIPARFPRPMARWWSFRATRRASPTKCSHRCSPSLT